MGIRNFIVAGLASLAALGWASGASAIVNLPVASNAYITVGGLDWAWAAPCPAVGGCGGLDLSYQSTQGWRLPTPAEFALHPVATDFIFSGANVPLGGADGLGTTFQAGTPPGAGACAASYFSASYQHCDWDDGNSGLWYDPAGVGDQYFNETLLVRDSGPVSAIPEPGAWAMMIVGFFGLGAALRGARRRREAMLAA